MRFLERMFSFNVELVHNEKEEKRKALKKIRKKQAMENAAKDHLEIPEVRNSISLTQRLR